MKIFNRRQFIATASALVTAPMAIAQTGNNATPSKVIHHVFFWLKNPGNQADKALLMEGLKTLTGVKQVKKLLIGTPARTEQRSVVDSTYDVSELMYFDSAAEQDEYQADPIHKAFVEKYSHLWEKVVVYDMLYSDL
ncbi:Dabb family protein [soil metagenome]